MNASSSRENHHPYGGGSHRIKSQKERPSVQQRHHFEPLQQAKTLLTHSESPSTSVGHSSKTAQIVKNSESGHYHRKSQSLDANAIAAQINNATPRIKER